MQLSGPRGPLSPAQSKAVLDRLKGSARESDIFERHLAVEEAVVGAPLTTGNEVVLLEDGPNTYRSMLAAIESARDHINLETYIIEDDDVGRAFAQALVAKQRSGVQVNLMHDSVGTLKTPRSFFEALQAAGIAVVEFNPINPLLARKDWQLNQRDHRKLLVVDGRVAFLGGINISSVYSSGSSGSSGSRSSGDRAPGPPWRDTDLQLRGPVVADLQKLFIDAWVAQKGPPLAPRNYFPLPENAGRQVVRAIGSKPDEAYSQIYATLLSAIGSAEKSVWLTNAYFAPDPQLLTVLTQAVARDVDVKLILPSQTDSWLVFHAGRAYYSELLEAGVKIYERRGAILHSKSALIDGVWSTVGSTNLDWRSFLHNHELNAVVLGDGFGRQMQAMFERDLAASEAITLAQWRKRSPLLRLKELFARAWEYWL
ncbi:MAG: cardiolipin synthase [Rubrivivax sp.]